MASLYDITFIHTHENAFYTFNLHIYVIYEFTQESPGKRVKKGVLETPD